MRLLLLCFLVIIHSVRSVYRAETSLPSNENETTYDVTNLADEPTYDYVVAVSFNLDESRIPEHLLDIIYDQASENSISSDDIATLYGMQTVSRNTTLDFLDQLSISAENVFSLDGFDNFLTELTIDFRDFYNRVVIGSLSLSGNPLRDLLETLKINVNNFSMGIAYGEPDPYNEFRKGDFSYETVVLALELANRTLDQLFEASRDEFVTQAISHAPEVVLDSLLKYGFDRATALKLWDILELNMTHVYNISRFRDLIYEIDRELNQVPYLGVLTAHNGVSINKKVYDGWEREITIATPKAESITSLFMLQIVDEVLTQLDSVVVLRVAAVEVEEINANITSIEFATTEGIIKDCKFVTLQNDTVVVREVEEAVAGKKDITIPRGNVIDVILGSPLICEDKVYGLAREISGDDIILDSFGSSGVVKVVLNSYVYIFAVAVSLYVHFL